MASSSSARTAAPCAACLATVTSESLPGAFLRRREDRPATSRRATLAHVDALPVLVLRAVALVRVVVRQLLAGSDAANRLDVDALSLVYRFAVRRTAVIDEARLVAVDRRVDHGLAVDGKQKGVVTAHAAVIVACVRFLRRDALTDVLDDACTLSDRANGESTAALDAGLAKLEVFVDRLRRNSRARWRGGCALRPLRPCAFGLGGLLRRL